MQVFFPAVPSFFPLRYPTPPFLPSIHEFRRPPDYGLLVPPTSLSPTNGDSFWASKGCFPPSLVPSEDLQSDCVIFGWLSLERSVSHSSSILSLTQVLLPLFFKCRQIRRCANGAFFSVMGEVSFWLTTTRPLPLLSSPFPLAGPALCWRVWNSFCLVVPPHFFIT